MEEAVKSLRLRIDSFAVLAKDSLQQSRQVNMCVDELFLSKAWLGKVLGHLGTKSPYPKDGERKNVADIEKTADQSSKAQNMSLYINEAGFGEKNPIERIDWLRQAIDESQKTAFDIFKKTSKLSDYMADNVLRHLAEARFWLGFELERQREDNL